MTFTALTSHVYSVVPVVSRTGLVAYVLALHHEEVGVALATGRVGARPTVSAGTVAFRTGFSHIVVVVALVTEALIGSEGPLGVGRTVETLALVGT